MNMENQGTTCIWLGTRRGQTGLAQLENILSLCPISATINTHFCGSKTLQFLSVTLKRSGAFVWVRSWGRCDLQPSRDHLEIWQCCYKQKAMRCTDVMKCPCCLRPKMRTCDILKISIWFWSLPQLHESASHLIDENLTVSECISS